MSPNPNPYCEDMIRPSNNLTLGHFNSSLYSSSLIPSHSCMLLLADK